MLHKVPLVWVALGGAIGFASGCSTDAADTAERCGPNAGSCGSGQLCIDGSCRAVCSDDLDCPKAEKCNGSYCVAGAGECSTDADCDAPAPCEKEDGRCIAGACEYSVAEDNTSCELELVAGNVKAGVCDSGQCRIFCPTNGNCPEGSFCDGEYCAPLLDLGEECDADGWCKTGACVDGYCCDGPCEGTCRSCNPNYTGSSGGCAPIQDRKDPQNECDDTYTCDGDGGCWSKNLGETCTHGGQCPLGRCAGKDASGEGICVGSEPAGSECSEDRECLSGYCVDGVCCESACAGTCKACAKDLTNADDGTCAPVPNGEGDAECGTQRGCNGAGACHPVNVDVDPFASAVNGYPAVVYDTTDTIEPTAQCWLNEQELDNCASPIRLPVGADATSLSFKIEVASASGVAPPFERVIERPIDRTRPALWWRFDDGGGNTAADATASQLDGKMATETSSDPAPTWQPGVIDGALEFSGKATVKTDFPLFEQSDAVTLEGWVRTSTPRQQIAISANGTWAVYTGHNASGTGNVLPLFDGSSGTNTGYPRGINDGRWHHIAATTYGPRTLTYVDGFLVGSQLESVAAMAQASDDAVAFHAGSNVDITQSYQGLLDEVRVFDYARSPFQVLQGAAALALSMNDLEQGLLRDASIHANHGTLQGNVAQTEGLFGNALELTDGGYVSIDATPSLDRRDSVTVAAWIKPDHLGSATQTIISKDRAEYALELTSNSLTQCASKIAFWFGGEQLCSQSSPRPEEWTHIAATYDGSVARVLVNGRVEAATSVTEFAADPQSPLTLGAAPGGLRPYTGQLDEVWVFPHALPPGRVDRLTAAVWYSFEEGTGTGTHDTSGHSAVARRMAGAEPANAGTGPSWADGVLDGGMTLDGGDGWLETGLPATLTNFTAEVWVRPSQHENERALLAQPAAMDASARWMLGIDTDGHPLLRLQTAGGQTVTLVADGTKDPETGYETAARAVPADTWSHVAAVYDGLTAVLFVNGEVVATKPIAGALAEPTETVSIGAAVQADAPASFYSGGLDEVRVFPYARPRTHIHDDAAMLATHFDHAQLHEAARGAVDSGPFAHTATAHGEPQSTADGYRGGGLSLNGGDNGTAQYIQVDTGVQMAQEAITVSGWVYPTEATDENRERGTLASGPGNMYLGLIDNQTNGGDSSYSNGHWAVRADGDRPSAWLGRIPVSTWTHLAGVYDGTSSIFYINGREVWQEALSGTIQAGTRYRIGTYVNDLVRHTLKGRVDELRILPAARPPSPGPVAVYPFDEAVDVAAGEPIRSAVGLPLDATASGNPQWTSEGFLGGAMSFDGGADSTADYLDVSPNGQLATDAITVMAWVYPTEAADGAARDRGAAVGGPGSMYLGIFDNGSGGTESDWSKAHWCVRANSRPCAVVGELPNNAWTHLAGVYDGTESRLYINGEKVWYEAQSGSIESGTVYRIGASMGDTNRSAFPGRIDEVLLYNHALSPAAIAAAAAAVP